MSLHSSDSQPARPFSGAVDELRQRAREYLHEHHTMSLATQGPQGPWAATVFYVSTGFDLYFRSKPNTRHVRNFATSARVAATISQDADDWSAVQGVQLEGAVGPVTDREECLQVMKAFMLKYPFVDTMWGTEGDARDELWTSDRSRQTLFRLRPERLRLYDHQYAEAPAELAGPQLVAPPSA